MVRSLALLALVAVSALACLAPTASASCPTSGPPCVMYDDGCVSYHVEPGTTELHGIQCGPEPFPDIRICRLDWSELPPRFKCPS